jgi:hypothetical protein
MNTMTKVALAAALLSGFSLAHADDLLSTQAAGKGGQNTVALDFVTSGDSVAFEFVVKLPKGATNVDLSSCLKGLPSTHKGQCVHHEKSGEVVAIAYSETNAKLPGGALALGNVRYTSLLKGGAAATIEGLVVADGSGKAIQSEIRSEDALLGN